MQCQLRLILGVIFLFNAAHWNAEAGWKAGAAKAVITPQQTQWMGGYGARTKPAQGTEHDLWIRVLVLEDEQGHRGVILSSDLLGFPKSISDELATRLKSKFGLDRSQILLHGSHTHCGPVLRGMLYDAYPIDASHIAVIEKYSEWLTDEVVATIGKAIERIQPATIARGLGYVDFAVNRRTNREADVPTLREQNLLMGPVDHTVPVLVVRSATNDLIAVVFAYACHNTTLDYLNWCGDYAGFAQYDLEARHPGAMALFCMGCGADQNPIPRRSVELAKSYGERLSAAVGDVLKGSLHPVKASLKTAHEFVPLQMQPLPTSEVLRKMADQPPNYVQRWATRMLKLIESGREVPREYPYPITAWKLGSDQLWIAMGGEVVVDYALRLKATHGDQAWITAYANDVMAYIPSKRVLLEGGYEGQSSMMVYGLPTERWSEDVEERIAAGISRCVERVDPAEKR